MLPLSVARCLQAARADWGGGVERRESKDEMGQGAWCDWGGERDREPFVGRGAKVGQKRSDNGGFSVQREFHAPCRTLR